jgi:polyribonucleotide 5'-hydroxyl-kinase
VPGSIGAVLVERPANIEEGGFAESAPLVYHYGHTTPGKIIVSNTLLAWLLFGFHQFQKPFFHNSIDLSAGHNPILFNRLVSRLADVVRERTSASRKAEVGGVVINTCGWVRGEGYNQIKHIAQVS